MSTPVARHGQRRGRPQRRNQLLALGLVAVAVLIFATAIGVAVVLHESEEQHVMAHD